MSYPVNPFRIGDTVKRAAWYAATLGADLASETGTVIDIIRPGSAEHGNSAAVTVKWDSGDDFLMHVGTYRIAYLECA